MTSTLASRPHIHKEKRRYKTFITNVAMPSTTIKRGEKHGNTSRLCGSRDSATLFSFAFPLSCCLQLLAKTILGDCSCSNKIVKQDKRQQTTNVSYSISITTAEHSGKHIRRFFFFFSPLSAAVDFAFNRRRCFLVFQEQACTLVEQLLLFIQLIV